MILEYFKKQHYPNTINKAEEVLSFRLRSKHQQLKHSWKLSWNRIIYNFTCIDTVKYILS